MSKQESLTFPGQVIGRCPEDPFLSPTTHWTILSNPIKNFGPGCPAACIYCNQQAFEVNNDTGEKSTPYISLMVDAGISLNTRLMNSREVVMEITPEVLAKELKKFPAYYPESPLMLENFNDPGVNWEQTINLIKCLRAIGHKGPMIFLTKFGIKDKYVAALAQLKEEGIKIVAGVTYANLPKEIEPIGAKERVKAVKKFNQAGIPTIVSMRPIIAGINDSEEAIGQVLDQVGPFATIITVGGLFVYDSFTHNAFKKAGYPLDLGMYPKNGYSPAKVLPDGFKNNVRRLARERNIQTPIMDHFSCSVAAVVTAEYEQPFPDRMARWANPFGNVQADCQNCPPYQKQVCREKSQESVEVVIAEAQKMAAKLGYDNLEIIPSYTIPGLLLVDKALLAINELFAMESYCGWDINNLPGKDLFIETCSRVVKDRMSLDFNCYLQGVEMINQDWYIYTSGLSPREQEVMLKHLRGNIRCRINLINNDQAIVI